MTLFWVAFYFPDFMCSVCQSMYNSQVPTRCLDWCVFQIIAGEDNDHIYYCTHHTMMALQVKTLDKIQHLLETNKTHPLITGIITHNLYTWMKLKHTTYLTRLNPI